ncbi:MAG: cupin domain-containing protein [Nocardioidaceae bacterium]
MTSTQHDHKGHVYGPGEGARAWWFLGSLMTLKAGTDDTNGSFTLLEQYMPPGFAPPNHIHHDEEEVFGIIEGHLNVMCGSDQWIARPGDTVVLPRGVLHGFSVHGDEPARIWHLTAPAKFERFVDQVGVPAEAMTLPGDLPIDIEETVRVAAEFGYEIVL